MRVASVFGDDGKTPTLDTDPMKAALTLLSTWKFKDAIMPKEADYNVADGMFKDGTAAMIINGDWAMGDYKKALGDKLAVGPIPQITGAGMPAPYTAGAFYMIPKGVMADANKSCVVTDFIKWSTNQENQIQMVKDIARLPALVTAIEDPIVTGDRAPRRRGRGREARRPAADEPRDALRLRLDDDGRPRPVRQER